jgi:plastocyanin
MKRRSAMLVTAALAALLIVDRPRSAGAADAPPTAVDLKRLETEIARLKQQVGEQRQLILQLMQMHDTLLKFVQSSSNGDNAAPTGPPPALESSAGAAAGARASAARSAGSGAAATGAGSGSGSETASVTGHVSASGAVPAEAYVYLEGPRNAPSRPPTIEIKQQGRRFVPTVAVIPVGSHVLFPNQDTVFHSVFSNTPGDAFDVGTLKAGQSSQPIAMLKPGHVEIFCNIHSKMRADVLVVPNVHWARVHSDGTYQLAGVPVGNRHITLWGPTLKPVSQSVEVKAGGSTATFSTETRALGPHPNKQGGAYGSYEN